MLGTGDRVELFLPEQTWGEAHVEGVATWTAETLQACRDRS